MKKAAFPLLLASSAKAESRVDSAMAADKAVPKPILIADVWFAGDCEDAANEVADAATAVGTATAALETLMTEREPLATAVDTAVTAKSDANAAVIAADAALATDLAADDTAQGTLLTLKRALDDATYAETAAVQAATDANTALTAAQDALDAGLLVQTAMDTAATNALTHYQAEQQQTIDRTSERDTAETTHTTLAAEESGLQTLYNNALTTSDATAATTATKKQEWDDARSLRDKYTTALTTAANAIDAGQSGSLAEAKANAETTLASKVTDMNTTRDAWTVLAQVTTTKMALWNATDYAEVNDGSNGCETTNTKWSGNYNGSNGTTDGTASDADCKGVCDGLDAWSTMTNNLPSGSQAIGGTAGGYDATVCYGYMWSTNNNSCLLAIGEVALSNGSAADDWACKKRNKVDAAADLITAMAASASGQTEYDAMITDLDEWATQQDAVLTATAPFNYSTEYHGLLNTASTDATSADSTAEGNYNSAKATSDTDAATTASRLQALTDKQTEIATALAAWEALKATVTAQTAEETRQLAIKNLADADKAAQDTLVTNLTSARDTASTAKDDADTASTDATTAKTDAQTAYDNQVTVADGTAAAIATPLSELATLRGTAATAATDLATAVSNVDDQDALIDAAKDTLEGAQAVHLAAVVACKEAKFDAYTTTLQEAIAQRAADLETIAALLDGEEVPARGAAGSRCEKALSNGTFRPARGETTCNEGLCCGAARIPQGNVMMTIETCQAEDATTFNWAPPRAPMATVAPDADPYPFTCIQGAQKLAAAASALAAAVYMLA